MQDTIIIVLLAVALIIGFLRGWYTSLLSMLLFSVTFAILYYVASSTLKDFIEYDLLETVYSQGITIYLDDGTRIVYTVEDLFLVTQEFDPSLSTEYLELAVNQTVEILTFAVCMIIALILSWIVYIPFRLVSIIIPKKIRTGSLIGRLFGGIISSISIFIVWSMVGVSLGQLVEAAQDILPILDNVDRIDFDFSVVLEYVDMIAPYVTVSNSNIMTAVYNILENLGINPYAFFSFEYNNRLCSIGRVWFDLARVVQTYFNALDSASDITDVVGDIIGDGDITDVLDDIISNSQALLAANNYITRFNYKY